MSQDLSLDLAENVIMCPFKYSLSVKKVSIVQIILIQVGTSVHYWKESIT